MKERFLTALHLIIIIITYTSPLWLDWKLIGLGVALYWIQIRVFKACVISIAQYGDTETSFVATYLNQFLKLFNKELKVDDIRFFLDWILPISFFILAVILQVYTGLIPLVSIY